MAWLAVMQENVWWQKVIFSRTLLTKLHLIISIIIFKADLKIKLEIAQG